MDISFVIPAYNAEENIKNCLLSILNNGYKPKEIIVVNDKSTDNTEKEVKKISKLSNIPIKVITTKKNSGPATARNLGAKSSNYDYVFFADSDTCLMTDTIQKATETIIKNENYIAAVVGLYNISRQENLIAKFKTSYYVYLLGERGIIEYDQFSASCALIRKKDFMEVGGYDEWFKPGMDLENEELGYRLIKNKKRIFLDPEVRCNHIFPSNLKLLYLFFHRTSLWFEMFFSRKKQAAVNSVQNAGYITLLPSIYLFLIVISALLKSKYIFFISFLILILYLILNLSYFKFYSRQNIERYILIFFGTFISHLAISLGALMGLIKILSNNSQIYKRFKDRYQK